MLPPPPPDGRTEHEAFANHIAARITEINRQRIRCVPEGGGWEDLPPDLRLNCHVNHRGQGHVDVFGRLSWSAPASTLTAGFDSFSRGRYGHPSADRPITGREGAALQSFPAWYRFVGPKKVVARQIGNAVPPLLAAALGRQILAALNSESRREPAEGARIRLSEARFARTEQERVAEVSQPL